MRERRIVRRQHSLFWQPLAGIPEYRRVLLEVAVPLHADAGVVLLLNEREIGVDVERGYQPGADRQRRPHRAPVRYRER